MTRFLFLLFVWMSGSSLFAQLSVTISPNQTLVNDAATPAIAGGSLPATNVDDGYTIMASWLPLSAVPQNSLIVGCDWVVDFDGSVIFDVYESEYFFGAENWNNLGVSGSNNGLASNERGPKLGEFQSTGTYQGNQNAINWLQGIVDGLILNKGVGAIARSGGASGDFDAFKLRILYHRAGDADLDGDFDSSDLVVVLQAGLYETGQPAGWTQGDWNGDGVFDSVDLVVALQVGGYEGGPQALQADIEDIFGE